MDPLTTLLAAAAATGPNTFQSQALTALRSAGPQESYFTRMGNPHPLQMQQLGQPTAPQLNPIITHPVSAPTALAQQIPMPILPLAHPMAESATTGLHIPTLQATRRMQQQAGPAPTMLPTMPQTPTVQPPAALPRDPTEYTQANFPSLTPRQLAVLAQLEMQDQQALRSSAHNILQPGHQTGTGGPAPSTGTGYTQPAPHHVLQGQNRRHSSAFVQSHAQHHEGRDRRAVCPPKTAAGAARGHSTDVTAGPEATARTDDPAATQRVEPIGADQGPLDPDPQAAPAGTKPSSSAAAPNLASRPAAK